MGMPVTVEVIDKEATDKAVEKVFDYFSYVDQKFSTYKDTSEISAINRGELPESNWSQEMKEIFTLSEETKKKTKGYFDIKRPDGKVDPSGLVKGWSIRNAAKILEKEGYKNFFVDVAGDIEARGQNAEGMPWTVGIRNPFNRKENVKIVSLDNMGIATSGTYVRGQHIYNPHKTGPLEEIVSLTVIGPNVYEADRFATPAFAMGRKGIYFIESLPGFEGYMIDKNGVATETTNFKNFVIKNDA